MVRLSDPALSIRTRDIDGADAILLLGTDPMHSMSILDLRIRKAIRRNGARLVLATERPTSLDGGASVVERILPGLDGTFVPGVVESLRGEPGSGPRADAADILREVENVVVIYGGPYTGDAGAEQLLELAEALGLAGKEGSGLLEVPATANGRGLREVGCIPDAGPGLARVDLSTTPGEWALQGGWTTRAIQRGLENGEIKGLVLFGVDPVREFSGTKEWEAAIGSADFVVCFSMFENETTAKADVVFPLETHAEKDGTVTHPDGRIQRVRPSAGRPGDIRPNVGVLAELSLALGHDTGLASQPEAFEALTEAVSFYSGIIDADLGGRGVRWQEGPAVARFPAASSGETGEVGQQPPGGGSESTEEWRVESGEGETVVRSGDIEVATYRDLWAGPITELNPPLKFLQPGQTLELSLADAERLGLGSGDEVTVSENGTSLRARVAVRERMREGTGYMIAGTANANANAFSGAYPGATTALVKVEKATP
jgi:NADH-quinone oxidoreductase subunit G